MKNHREFSQAAAVGSTVISKTHQLEIPLNEGNHSGFDLTVSAVVTEYLASCEHKQVFLVKIAFEVVPVPPLRFLLLFPPQDEMVVQVFHLLVAQLSFRSVLSCSC